MKTVADFLNAVIRGDITQVRELLAQGIDINSTDEHGRTGLFLACCARKYNLVKELLERGADINKSNNHGEKPLIIAAALGELSLVRLLLNYQANINATDNKGMTALANACFHSEYFIAEELLKRGANVDKAAANGMTPLMIAVSQPSFPLVQLLLDHNPDLDATDETGTTALSIACRWGSYGNIRALLKKGADVNIPNNDGTTSLMVAVFASNFILVKDLINYNAKLSAAAEMTEKEILLVADILSLAAQYQDAEFINVVLKKLSPEQKKKVFSKKLPQIFANFKNDVVGSKLSAKSAQCFKALLSHGANLLHKQGENLLISDKLEDEKWRKMLSEYYNDALITAESLVGASLRRIAQLAHENGIIDVIDEVLKTHYPAELYEFYKKLPHFHLQGMKEHYLPDEAKAFLVENKLGAKNVTELQEASKRFMKFTTEQSTLLGKTKRNKA